MSDDFSYSLCPLLEINHLDFFLDKYNSQTPVIICIQMGHQLYFISVWSNCSNRVRAVQYAILHIEPENQHYFHRECAIFASISL